MEQLIAPTPLTAEVPVPEKAVAMINRYGRSLAMAEATVIESKEDADRVAGDIRTLKQRRVELEQQRDFVLAPAASLVERVKSLFFPALNAIDSADKVLRSKLLAWNEAETARVARERREAEERQRAERQAAEAAAAEARRIARAEAERLAAEARAAEAAGQAEAAAKARESAARVVENAEAIASVREMEASASVAVIAAPATAKGTGGRDNWKAEPVGTEEQAVDAIVNAIVAGRRDLIGLLLLNGPACNALARATKTNFSVPGMRATNNRTTVVR